MTDLATKIKIMQAALDGQGIEYKFNDIDGWITATNPSSDDLDGLYWDWEGKDYRIKSVPMEFWVNVYSDQSISYGYDSKAECVDRSTDEPVKTIKVREITE